jgi:predicted nucleic acid-binding protein
VYLLDTNVVSELRKPKRHQGVVAWVQNASEETLHLSAVTIGEIPAGIEITREQAIEKSREIETWLDSVAETYNAIPVDAHIFRPLGATDAPSIRSSSRIRVDCCHSPGARLECRDSQRG